MRGIAAWRRRRTGSDADDGAGNDEDEDEEEPGMGQEEINNACYNVLASVFTGLSDDDVECVEETSMPNYSTRYSQYHN